jgi:surfeit locus 1 family protein
MFNAFRSSLRYRPRVMAQFSTKAQQEKGKDVIPGRDYLGMIVFGGLCAGTFTLGTWQVQRYFWKINVIEEARKLMNESLEHIPPGAGQFQLSEIAESLRGRRIAVKGIYEHEREVAVGPRSAPAGLFGAGAQGLATNPQGYYIITPLKREDGTVVFINRGWVSDKAKDWDRPKGVVEVMAVVGAAEKSGYFTPENNPSSGRLLWLEPSALVKAAKYVSADHSDSEIMKNPVILDKLVPNDEAVEFYPAPRRPRDVDNHYVQPVTHATYAFTWYALCMAGTVMTYNMFKKKKIRGIRKL